jgi:iron complex outermembrane receptor protein
MHKNTETVIMARPPSLKMQGITRVLVVLLMLIVSLSIAAQSKPELPGEAGKRLSSGLYGLTAIHGSSKQQGSSETSDLPRLSRLSGKVTDEAGNPLPGATVTLNDNRYGTVTDRNGTFQFRELEQGWYVVEVSYLGCEKSSRRIHLPYSQQLYIQLKQEAQQLQEVTISDYALQRSRQTAASYQYADREFLQQNESGSLMQTLSRLPGISSMDIGSGNSKPVIRGLGFNRVVVAENGLRHEGQEWGHDHGLEIDQESVERIEIIKGPASLMYGSNAIVGVIDLKQLSVPARNSHEGNVELKAASNNQLLGFSGRYAQRRDRWYWKARISGADYADYRVPTDSIEYMSYYFKLKDSQLRNTAGYEYNAGTTIGYLGDYLKTHLTVSNVFSKSGFFANAHGLEIRNSAIPYDESDRDIDLPSQQVNHFKIMSNSFLQYGGIDYQLDMGFQHNLRKEFSEPLPHGYMPVPPDSLERLFSKTSASAHLSANIRKLQDHDLKTGISADFQHNERGGWGFILPDYISWNAGLYAIDNYRLSEKWLLTAGLRYDIGHISTGSYRDWYTTPVDGGSQAMERAWELSRTFHSLSWGTGAVYAHQHWQLKMNIGKSFRMPNAKELASNGLNYHMYRFEKGDSTLKAEESYQLDMGISITRPRWELHLSPFVNYFPNYIYLNPTAQYYEAQQVFYHRQSEVFRTGGELSALYRFNDELSAGFDLEYIYSVQLSGEKKGYTLPFSPPLNSVFGLTYEKTRLGSFSKAFAAIDLHLTAAQNNIVPPEKKTPGYQLVHLRTGAILSKGKMPVQFQLQLRNIFNTKYYDHTSFYRLIEVPGAGRNITASIQFQFN